MTTTPTTAAINTTAMNKNSDIFEFLSHTQVMCDIVFDPYDGSD
jgi:hypothetical protein